MQEFYPEKNAAALKVGDQIHIYGETGTIELITKTKDGPWDQFYIIRLLGLDGESRLVDFSPQGAFFFTLIKRAGLRR